MTSDRPSATGSSVILRPTRRALLNSAIRAAVMVVPGGLLVFAAWSSGAITPGVFGLALILLGLLIFANPTFSRLQLDAGVLSGRSLLGRRRIQVDEITRIIPINLSYRRTLLMPLKRSARMFDVCTETGPAGLWLNPKLFGDVPIQRLIKAIGVEPEGGVEDRVLDVMSTNRDYSGDRPRP